MVEANKASDTRPIVTITGISGFLGSHVGLTLLKDGTFRVRGTVRSLKNADKIEPLRKAYGDELFSKLELIEADLLDEESLKKAIQGSTHVLHTASPFVIESPKDENVLIKPALEGTLSVMRACQEAKVRRVSVTSSVAAIHHKDTNNLPE